LEEVRPEGRQEQQFPKVRAELTHQINKQSI
jgi:hypothetical protein